MLSSYVSSKSQNYSKFINKCLKLLDHFAWIIYTLFIYQQTQIIDDFFSWKPRKAFFRTDVMYFSRVWQRKDSKKSEQTCDENGSVTSSSRRCSVSPPYRAAAWASGIDGGKASGLEFDNLRAFESSYLLSRLQFMVRLWS